MSRKTLLISGLITILILGATIGYFVWFKSREGFIMCTQEAKLCPDGSTVGRSGPNCEFAPCPAGTSTNLKTYRNGQYGFEIRFPKSYSLRTEPVPNQDSKNWVEGFIPFGKATGDTGIEAVILMPNPKQAYPNTDLDQAFIAIKIPGDQGPLNCGEIEGYIGELGGEIINDNQFEIRSTGSGAAGHQVERREYATNKNGLCYIVTEVIYTSGYGAVEGLKQINENDVFAKLHETTLTFRFLRQ